MISTAIMHAPRSAERAANVAALLRLVPGAVVVRDDDGTGEIRVGVRRGCWPIARRAWTLALDGAAAHHLVLEDDAVPCARFAELVGEACARAPEAAILYFWGDRGCSVATSMPTTVLPRWLAWADREAERIPHHDMLVRIGCKNLGVQLLRTDPSLVEHGPFDSLLEHGPVGAVWFDPSPTRFDLITVR